MRSAQSEMIRLGSSRSAAAKRSGQSSRTGRSEDRAILACADAAHGSRSARRTIASTSHFALTAMSLSPTTSELFVSILGSCTTFALVTGQEHSTRQSSPRGCEILPTRKCLRANFSPTRGAPARDFAENGTARTGTYRARSERDR